MSNILDEFMMTSSNHLMVDARTPVATAGEHIGANPEQYDTRTTEIINESYYKEAVDYTAGLFKEFLEDPKRCITEDARRRNTSIKDLQKFTDKYVELSYNDIVATTDGRLVLNLPYVSDDILKGKPYISKNDISYYIDISSSYSLSLEDTNITKSLTNASVYTVRALTDNMKLDRQDKLAYAYYKTLSPMLPTALTINGSSYNHIMPIGFVLDRLNPLRYDIDSKVVIFKDNTVSALDAYYSKGSVDKVTKYNEFGSLDKKFSNYKPVDITKQHGYAFYHSISSESEKYPAWSPVTSIANSIRREYDNTFNLGDTHRTPIALPNVVFNPITKKVFILHDVSHRIKLNRLLEAKYSTSLINREALDKIKSIVARESKILGVKTSYLPTIKEIASFIGVDEEEVMTYVGTKDTAYTNLVKVAVKELIKKDSLAAFKYKESLLNLFKRAINQTVSLISFDIVTKRAIRLQYVHTLLRAYSISGVSSISRSDTERMNEWYAEQNYEVFDTFLSKQKQPVPNWIISNEEKVALHQMITKLFTLVKLLTNTGASNITTLDAYLTDIYKESLTSYSPLNTDEKEYSLIEYIDEEKGYGSQELEESIKAPLRLDLNQVILNVIKLTFTNATDINSVGSAEYQLEEITMYLEVVKHLTEVLGDAETELGDIRTELVETLNFDDVEAMERLSTNDEATTSLSLYTGCITTDSLLGGDNHEAPLATGQLLSVGGLSNMGKSSVTARLMAGATLANNFAQRIKGINTTTKEDLVPYDVKIVAFLDQAIRSLLIEKVPVSFTELQDLTKAIHISAEDEISIVMQRYLTDMGITNIYGSLEHIYKRVGVSLNRQEVRLLTNLILVATRVNKNLFKAYQSAKSILHLTKDKSAIRWLQQDDEVNPLLLEIETITFNSPEYNTNKFSAYAKKLQYVMLSSVGLSRYIRIALERQNPTKVSVDQLLLHTEAIAPDASIILIDYVDKYLEADSTSSDKRHVYKQLKSIAFTHDTLIMAPNQLSSAMMIDTSEASMNLPQAIERSMKEPRYQGIATLKTELDIELVSYTVKQLGNDVPIRVISANKKRYGNIKAYPFVIFLYEPERLYDEPCIPLDTITFNEDGTYKSTPTCMTVPTLAELNQFAPQLIQRIDNPAYQGAKEQLVKMKNTLANTASNGSVGSDVKEQAVVGKISSFDAYGKVTKPTKVVTTDKLSDEYICRLYNVFNKDRLDGCGEGLPHQDIPGTIPPKVVPTPNIPLGAS